MIGTPGLMALTKIIATELLEKGMAHPGVREEISVTDYLTGLMIDSVTHAQRCES